MANIATFTTTRDTATTFDPTATTGNMTTGAASQTVDMSSLADEKVIIKIINTSATAGDDVKVTVKAGNGFNTRGKDLVKVVGDGEECYIGPLTSMDFKNETGTNRGKVVIEAAKATTEGLGVAGDIKLCAIIIDD